jgi:hypothetical protein
MSSANLFLLQDQPVVAVLELGKGRGGQKRVARGCWRSVERVLGNILIIFIASGRGRAGGGVGDGV